MTDAHRPDESIATEQLERCSGMLRRLVEGLRIQA
jgi:di/tripeptidase